MVDPFVRVVRLYRPVISFSIYFLPSDYLLLLTLILPFPFSIALLQ